MNISKLQFITLFLSAGLLASAAFSSSQVLAQNKQLILQTQPEPTVIELQGNMQIDGSGHIRVTPVDPEACTATGSCEDVDVQVSSFTVNNQANSVSVNQGQNLIFRWNTRGAWACTGSGLSGWTGTGKPAANTSGVAVSTSNVSPDSYQVSLNCYNGSVQASTTPSVTVEVKEAGSEPPPDPEPIPQICDSRQSLPSNWNRLTTGSNSCSYRFAGTPGGSSGRNLAHDCREFNKVWPWDWEDQNSLQRVLGAPGSHDGRHYMALGFNSGDKMPTSMPPTGHNYYSFALSPPQTSSLENRPKLVSISRCPGDFDKAAIDADMGPGCIREINFQNVLWGGPHYRSNSGVCALEPNTDYYLNIIYTLSPVGTPPAQIQPDSECATGPGCGTRWAPAG